MVHQRDHGRHAHVVVQTVAFQFDVRTIFATISSRIMVLQLRVDVVIEVVEFHLQTADHSVVLRRPVRVHVLDAGCIGHAFLDVCVIFFN